MPVNKKNIWIVLEICTPSKTKLISSWLLMNTTNNNMENTHSNSFHLTQSNQSHKMNPKKTISLIYILPTNCKETRALICCFPAHNSLLWIETLHWHIHNMIATLHPWISILQRPSWTRCVELRKMKVANMRKIQKICVFQDNNKC